jgi:hypothetical protein
MRKEWNKSTYHSTEHKGPYTVINFSLLLRNFALSTINFLEKNIVLGDCGRRKEREYPSHDKCQYKEIIYLQTTSGIAGQVEK